MSRSIEGGLEVLQRLLSVLGLRVCSGGWARANEGELLLEAGNEFLAGLLEVLPARIQQELLSVFIKENGELASI